MKTATEARTTDERFEIARTYVIAHLDDLLYFADLTEVMGEPFVRPDYDNPEHLSPRLAEIEGVPLRVTLGIDDEAWEQLLQANQAPGAGTADVLAWLRENTAN